MVRARRPMKTSVRCTT
ncbi:Protein of unknown function [Propionibacterium freudenreichii]|nr:Protein of unknown function [Propionibacterium freudenreichii]CEI22535.1 Protein of unknown function [Propionibacterium freudenreichii]CEI29614.1 Protein of unknown function [Propionibacterium freudenreichii]